MNDDGEQRTSAENGGGGRKPMSVRETSGYLVESPADQRPPQPSRTFLVDEEEWVVRIAGEGSGGAGLIVAMRFCRAAVPDTPVRELLTGSIDLDSLHPEELRRLFERAERIDPAD